MTKKKMEAWDFGRSHYVKEEREGLSAFKCSRPSWCCQSLRAKVASLVSSACAIVFIVLLALPGGIVLFIEPTFGEFTDVSGIDLDLGFGTLDITGNVKVQIVNENIFPLYIREIEVFLAKESIRIDLSPPEVLIIAGQSSIQFDVGLSATFGVGDSVSIAVITGECITGSSEFELLGSLVATYHVVTQQRDFSGVKLDLGC